MVFRTASKDKIGDFYVAQSLGTVTKREQGGFEGTLSLMAHKTRITIVPNEAKENDRQPDYRIYSRQGGEIGGAWNRTGKTSKKPYVLLTFAHPDFGPQKLYANLGRAAGQDDENVLAILWNPQR